MLKKLAIAVAAAAVTLPAFAGFNLGQLAGAVQQVTPPQAQSAPKDCRYSECTNAERQASINAQNAAGSALIDQRHQEQEARRAKQDAERAAAKERMSTQDVYASNRLCGKGRFKEGDSKKAAISAGCLDADDKARIAREGREDAARHAKENNNDAEMVAFVASIKGNPERMYADIIGRAIKAGGTLDRVCEVVADGVSWGVSQAAKGGGWDTVMRVFPGQNGTNPQGLLDSKVHALGVATGYYMFVNAPKSEKAQLRSDYSTEFMGNARTQEIYSTFKGECVQQ